MERIYIYPYDQHSEGATKVARALDCQKLLRKGSRYQRREGDVIVNWGASDCPFDDALNADLVGTIDKREFFHRTRGSIFVPRSLTVKRNESRVEAAVGANLRGNLNFPILCRTKVKAHDGDGIVIAENPAQLVDAALYVELKPKTAEYRVHMARRNGQVEILGVQQKFLPKERKDKDIRIRTTANGCYFAWTVDGEPVVLPESAKLACLDVFAQFPELTFGGFDVIYNQPNGQSYVIEINSAPELTEKAAEMYAEFFNRFRVPEVAPVEAQGPQQLDYAGEVLPVGNLRDPIYEDRYYQYLGAEADEVPEMELHEAEPRMPMEEAFFAAFPDTEQNNDEHNDLLLYAFSEGWKARKEADYALIYNG